MIPEINDGRNDSATLGGTEAGNFTTMFFLFNQT